VGSPTGRMQSIAGVERALDVLSLFTEEGVRDLGVTEIAEKLDLSKAVVHRILSSFRVKGYAELDESTRRYSLAPRILTLGLSYLNRLDGQEIARAALRELVERTNETATQSVRAGWSRVYVAQETPSRDIKMVVQIGSAFPLHAGASSKAFLAFLPPGEREAYFAERDLDRLTDHTITDRRRLEKELAEIRRRGYARSFGERQPGAGAVAAPVFDHRDQPVSVISVCGPVERFRDEVDRCAGALLDVTARVSRKLGSNGSVVS
jgi:IclR family transcriptional regulator, acetate operon repressor